MLTKAPELMTAITDLILGVIAIFLSARILFVNTKDKIGQNLYTWIFILLAGTSIGGAVLHGFVMSQKTNEFWWYPLSYFLGLTTSLFVVAFMYQWKGNKVYKKSLITMIVLSLVFLGTLIGYSFYSKDYFIIFIIYSSLTMIFAFVLSVIIAVKNKKKSAYWFMFGILLMLVASGLQAGLKQYGFRYDIIMEFDHNTVYHLVMIIAILFIYKGVRCALLESTKTKYSNLINRRKI